MSSLSQNIIEHSKRLYPISLHYRGRFTDKQINEIAKLCDIHCSSVYMDGSAMYCVRYKGESEDKDSKENKENDKDLWERMTDDYMK